VNVGYATGHIATDSFLFVALCHCKVLESVFGIECHWKQ
jgi:hypothetical protein